MQPVRASQECRIPAKKVRILDANDDKEAGVTEDEEDLSDEEKEEGEYSDEEKEEGESSDEEKEEGELDDDLKEKSEKPDDGKDWDQFDANFKLTGRHATCVGVTFKKSLRKLYP